MNNKEEYIKCLKDQYYFINNYCILKDKNTEKYIKLNFNKNT